MSKDRIDTRLKTIRLQSGLSQRELAERSGVSISVIRTYEQPGKDIGNARISTVYALAAALGCKIEDLFRKDAE